jgi:AcrR family transcriptional regulator
MSGMSIPYEEGGRTAQKRRTRDALVAAARDMVAAGVTPTVDEAASMASISRTTAYRYFPNRRALLVAAHPETGATTMLPVNAPEDPAARLELVVRSFTRLIVETEAQQRTMLRLSLEADPLERAALPLRQGRAIAWIGEALAPLHNELSDPEFRHLVLAIRSVIGIEALAWLTDVGGLSRNQAVELMCWSARSLLRAALASSPPLTTQNPRTRRSRKSPR